MYISISLSLYMNNKYIYIYIHTYLSQCKDRGDGTSRSGCIFHRTVTFPVDFPWNLSNGFSVAFCDGVSLL